MTTLHRHLVLLLTSFPALAGCLANDDTSPPLATTATSAALTAQDIHLAFERGLLAADAARSQHATEQGFVNAILDTITPDAAYLALDHPILHGRAAITALLDGDDPGRHRRATFDPRRATVSADGLLGNTFGWNLFTVAAPDGTTTTSFGKYSTIWERRPGGWRVIVHVENATGFTPSPAPGDFPLLDPARPVIKLDDPRRTAAQIADADRAFAAAAAGQGTGPAFPAFADEHAVEVAGPIIYGVDEVAANHADDPPPSETLATWAPADAGASFTGDLGWTIGNATFTEGADVAYTKYLTVWKREADGSWKWTADMGNGSPAPASAP